ncbi:MAG: glycoside hydrolase family 31 protein [Myxococcaceae bacterium]
MRKLLLLASCALVACPPPKPPTSATLRTSAGTVIVDTKPFVLTLTRADGSVRMRTTGGPRFTRDDGQDEGQLVPGWDGFKSKEREWVEFTDATLVSADATTVKLEFSKDGLVVQFEVSLDGVIARTRQSISDTRRYNKSALAFELTDDDHFFGMGQRTASIDHRGLTLYSWAEEGGLGGGENTPLSDTNPYPNGPSMTYFPVPFFHTTKSTSVLVDGTRRSEVHFGSSAPELKIAIDGAELALVFFLRNDPLDALNDYTALTGRPPIPADWAWGPRRRINRGAIIDGLPEWAQMRARKLPLTTVDDAMHSLPSFSQKGIEDQLRTWTTELHDNGFKVMDYNNPYVSASAPNSAPDYQYGAAHGFFEMAPDGGPATSFFLSGGPQTISTMDLTNPDAVTWFQGLLQRSFDLGYDGWMHDFGEYVNRSSRFFDGRTGLEVHNEFPVLSAKAMRGAIEGHDAHVFTRSGYTGSQAWILEDWGGDPEATFDETEGLPAMLRGGLNLSMAAVPYWSTDIGGYKCITDAPNDKEMLVRWYEMSALSPMMHDEDACSNPVGASKTKAKLWDDQQTQDVWRTSAGLHTRLAPYLRALALEARAHGRPLTIHPVLLFPRWPEAWAVQDSFFLGPSLYGAPVVRRGVTTRHVWLPPGAQYVEWTERTVHPGGNYVDVPAPLDRLPLFLVSNQLVPLLDEDVQTLAPALAPDAGVVTEADRRGVLDVIAAISKGGAATFTLADGTKLTITRLANDEGNPGQLAPFADDAAFRTCSSCGATDTLGTRRVRIATSAASAQLADVKVEVSGGPGRTIRWEVLPLD